VRKRTLYALDLVGLAAMADRYASRLLAGSSNASRSRAMAEPEVLLLDEPLSNLDAALREQMCSEPEAARARGV
jgi:ABC-type Fe3+/spermidine/putrescine transport system ATPase subunit